MIIRKTRVIRVPSMNTHWKGNTPQAPYYAVIFISKKGANREGYDEMDEHLMMEAQKQEGYLGYSSVSSESGSGIFISYWKDEESIARWREYSEHKKAKAKAKQGWYAYFHSLICEVKSSQIFEQQWTQLKT